MFEAPAESAFVHLYDPALDESLVYDSWLHAFKRSAPGNGHSPKYFHGQRRIIGGILARGRCLVATSQDRAQVLGWICWEPPRMLHFAYTRLAFRRYGIMRRLLTEAFPVAGDDRRKLLHSHDTPMWPDVARGTQADFTWEYEPYAAHWPFEDL